MIGRVEIQEVVVRDVEEKPNGLVFEKIRNIWFSLFDITDFYSSYLIFAHDYKISFE